ALSATHSGLVALNARPQEFFRLGSTIMAPWSLRSETRLVCLNWFPGAEAWAAPPGIAMAAATTAGTATASALMVSDRGRENLEGMDYFPPRYVEGESGAHTCEDSAHAANPLPGRRPAEGAES